MRKDLRDFHFLHRHVQGVHAVRLMQFMSSGAVLQISVPNLPPAPRRAAQIEKRWDSLIEVISSKRKSAFPFDSQNLRDNSSLRQNIFPLMMSLNPTKRVALGAQARRYRWRIPSTR